MNHHSQEIQASLLRLLTLLGEHVGEAALAAVLTIEVGSHEHARPAACIRADLPQSRNLTIAVNLVVLEHMKLNLER